MASTELVLKQLSPAMTVLSRWMVVDQQQRDIVNHQMIGVDLLVVKDVSH